MTRLLLLCLLFSLVLVPSAQAQTPVVLLVLDEFPGAALEDKRGQVDRKRFPHLARIARQGTYYPNASTNADLTIRAVPSLSSGSLLERGNVSSRQTLYSLLRDSHHITRYEEFGELGALCPFCSKSSLLTQRFGGLPLRGNDAQILSVKATLASMRTLAKPQQRPHLWSSHMILPYAPYRFLASGSQYPLTELSKNPGIASDKSELYWDKRLPLLAQQRFLLQARFVDKIIGRLRQQMIKGGIWHKSLVIITSDHGASFSPGTYRRGIERRNYEHIANVPLVIKYPGQQQAKVDRGSTQLIDLLPTIAAVTGTKPDWESDGLSLLEPRPERPSRVYGAYGAGWQEKDFARFVADRRRLVQSWNRRFPVKAERVWLGPRPSLRGRKLAPLSIRSDSSLAANIELADRFRAVKLRSGWRPALLSGTLRGIGSGAPLVAALNGRIVSGGYSYRVGSQRRFVLLLPESRLRSGNNSVGLYLVRGKRLVKIKSAGI